MMRLNTIIKSVNKELPVIKETDPKPNVSLVNSSILTIMFTVFLTLKLTGNIDWSWWWVTSPLWLPIAMVFGIIGIIFIASVFILIGRGIK